MIKGTNTGLEKAKLALLPLRSERLFNALDSGKQIGERIDGVPPCVR